MPEALTNTASQVEITPVSEAPQHHPECTAARTTIQQLLLTIRQIIFSSIVNVLLVFVPVGIAAQLTGLPAGVVFAMNAVAIVPLAGLLTYATESLASYVGDTVGALMNVTFGNAVELIIFIVALVKDHIRIVQASLVGSILSNMLLILGMCFLLGGLRYREQVYNSTVTQTSACLLSLSVTSLLLPTAFHASFTNSIAADDKVLQVSRGTSVIILLVYLLYLVFQLKSHSYIFAPTPQHIVERESAPGPAAQYFHNDQAPDSSQSSLQEETDGSKPRSDASELIHSTMLGKDKDERLILDQSNHDGPDTAVNRQSASNLSRRRLRSLSEQELILCPSQRNNHTVSLDESVEWNGYCQGHKSRSQPGVSHSRSSDGHGSPSQGPSRIPRQEQDGIGRIDFASGPTIEAQAIPSQLRPLSILALRPSTTSRLATCFNEPVRNSWPTTGVRRAFTEPVCHAQEPIVRSQRARGSDPTSVAPTTGSPDTLSTVQEPPKHHPCVASRNTAIILLLISTALVAVCAEFMISSIDELVATDPGLSEAFIGLILLPVVGNAAEHVTSVSMALKNKMDLAIGVAVGSSIQIALFVTPLVVLLGWALGKDMSLFFTLFETVCVFVSTFIVNFLVLDGRSNYLEGALLCAGYVIIAVAAFFYPDAQAANSLGGGN